MFTYVCTVGDVFFSSRPNGLAIKTPPFFASIYTLIYIFRWKEKNVYDDEAREGVKEENEIHTETERERRDVGLNLRV